MASSSDQRAHEAQFAAFLDETLIAIQVAGIAIVLFGVTIARPARGPGLWRGPSRLS